MACARHLVPLLALLVPGRVHAQCAGNTTGLVPLPDLGETAYLGFPGGLYPGGSNELPPAHLADALGQAALVVPRDAAGAPDAERGLIGFVAIGMSSLCHKWGRFEYLEDAAPDRHPRAVLVNGANGGSAADKIRNPGDPYWNVLLDRVAKAGLSNAQVQVAWFEEAYQNPPSNFPQHALDLVDDMTTIVGIARGHFPNLRLLYVSCRSYGNYAIPAIEPVSYENGFANKWLIENQIVGDPLLNWDPARGPVLAPLLVWGPYLWADGLNPNGTGNSAGLSWCACDYEQCFDRHLDEVGEEKVWQLMHDQLRAEPLGRAWYVRPDGPHPSVLEPEADAWVDSAVPNENFGATATLLSRSGSKVAYLRFDASGVRRPVLHAKLSLNNFDEAVTLLRTVSDSAWDEATISFSNRPPIDGTENYPMPNVTRDGTRSVDVTDAVNQDDDGVVTFALFNTLSFDGAVSSREGQQPPRLVLLPEPLPRPTQRQAAAPVRKP